MKWGVIPRDTGIFDRHAGGDDTVETTGNGGQPATPDSVTFAPAMPQMGHATTPVAAVPQGDGRYRADVDLSMAGQWDITVRIAVKGQVHEAVLSVTTNG